MTSIAKPGNAPTEKSSLWMIQKLPLLSIHIDTSPPTIFKYRGVALPSCLCQPRVHSSYADCFEHTVYDAVIKAHVQPQAPPVPLSPPPFRSSLRGRGGQRCISHFIQNVEARRPLRDGCIVGGGYILLYRLYGVTGGLIHWTISYSWYM